MSQRITISEDQRKALEETSGGPVFFMDETSGEEIVIIRAAAYRRLSKEFSISDTYEAQERALAPIWNEPELDDYNDVAPSGP
jgi:hypothetical protein